MKPRGGLDSFRRLSVAIWRGAAMRVPHRWVVEIVLAALSPCLIYVIYDVATKPARRYDDIPLILFCSAAVVILASGLLIHLCQVISGRSNSRVADVTSIIVSVLASLLLISCAIVYLLLHVGLLSGS